mgnify:CR=1 FL=1
MYSAPVDDIAFTLKHVAGLEDALSQGVLLAGILSVLLMGAGTAITVAALATLAVLAKGIASRMGGSNSRVAGVLVWWAELLGAALVLMFGVLLLIASL